MKRKLFATLAIAFVVLAMLACGIGPVSVSFGSTPTLAAPTVAPTATPRPNYDAEVEYLDVQGAWADDCSDALTGFDELFNNYDISYSWTETARAKVLVAYYYCAYLGGYETVPDRFVYVQSEVDNARADYGTAFDYAADFVNSSPITRDANTMNYSFQLYFDKGTAHISNAKVEMERATDEIK